MKNTPGRAANIAVAIAKLGGKSQLISPVGTDFSSSGYEKLLKEAYVDLSRLYTIEDRKISKAFIFTDREDNQTTYFYWGASSKFKELEPEPVDFVHLATADCVYNAKIAQIAGFVSFDPGQDLVTYSKENLETILAHTDILFANKHEIKRVSEMTGKSFSELRDMIDVIVVTYDAEGSIIYRGGDQWSIPVVSVKALDPTGAGDAYRAGFCLHTQESIPFQPVEKSGQQWLLCRTVKGLPDQSSDMGRNEVPLRSQFWKSGSRNLSSQK